MLLRRLADHGPRCSACVFGGARRASRAGQLDRRLQAQAHMLQAQVELQPLVRRARLTVCPRARVCKRDKSLRELHRWGDVYDLERWHEHEHSRSGAWEGAPTGARVRQRGAVAILASPGHWYSQLHDSVREINYSSTTRIRGSVPRATGPLRSH